MAVVLEGYCVASLTSGTVSIFSHVENFSGDYVSESLCIYIYSSFTNNAYKIQSYSNSAWSYRNAAFSGTIPYSFTLYLVRSSDFSENRYSWSSYGQSFEELALGKYICNIEKKSVRTYWAPATTPLSTPTGLYADNITSDSARVSWTAVENASGYRVEYRQSAGGGADLSLDRSARLAGNVSQKGGV